MGYTKKRGGSKLLGAGKGYKNEVRGGGFFIAI